jgi:hypothetical protein
VAGRSLSGTTGLLLPVGMKIVAFQTFKPILVPAIKSSLIKPEKIVK